MKAAVDLRRSPLQARATPLADHATQSGKRATMRAHPDLIALPASDGYPLTGTYYAARGEARAHLVVAGAVGVPQRFYRRFAQVAAANRFSTMTFDYRGIGLSAPGSLKNFEMDYFDWGRIDLAAAVTAMSSADLPLYVVGHSFGGHQFGVLPNHQQVTAFYTFGTGAGWHGWMPRMERVRVLALWHILGPLLTRCVGYLPWSLLHMGEDLPLVVYRRWKHWCRYPHYFFDDPSVPHDVRAFRRLRAPMMAANSIDDRWAPPASRDAFMAGYANAQRHSLDIDPATLGLRAIGHMGYFRRDARPLWESALAWLASHPRRQAVVSSAPGEERVEPRAMADAAPERRRWLALIAASSLGA